MDCFAILSDTEKTEQTPSVTGQDLYASTRTYKYPKHRFCSSWRPWEANEQHIGASRFEE
jgi:hypothetical protein